MLFPTVFALKKIDIEGLLKLNNAEFLITRLKAFSLFKYVYLVHIASIECRFGGNPEIEHILSGKIFASKDLFKGADFKISTLKFITGQKTYPDVRNVNIAKSILWN